MTRLRFAGLALLFTPGLVQAGQQGQGANPFTGASFFIDPEYAARVEATAQKFPNEAATIRKVEFQPTGLWLDSIAKVANVPGWLDKAKKQQIANGRPTVTMLIVYDLPNRDCAASSSAGELRLENNGEARYRSELIDPLAVQFQAHPDQPIVVILEPDSLSNLATNMGLPACVAAWPAYKSLTVYALKKFALPNVSVYLDAAHAGWLGWDDNRAKIARIYKKVLVEAGGTQMIRGFAANVSNYTHLQNRDGAVLEPSNPCPNELSYAKTLGQTLSLYGIKDKGFLVDTSRNGKGGIRTNWGNWCNIKGAGLGERPRANPEPGIDAFVWAKPPGESDGTSDRAQPRFDEFCASPDSAKGAPQAGQWFESYFIDLIHNARPPL
jgi:cellulose 1,4-beta-cellobiosidase